MHILKIFLKLLALFLGLVVFVVGGYIIYLQVNYDRVPDGTQLPVYGADGAESVPSPSSEQLLVNNSYTAATYNIGFGAYNRDFSFFMDEGIMEDGTPTVGTGSKAKDKESVIDATRSCIDWSIQYKPDIALFQEVDVQADRSYDVNQRQMILDAYTDSDDIEYWTYGVNFHTGYLAYPPTKPIGAIKDSGLLTMSKFPIENSVRRSFPVDVSFITKFFDLDRCFVVNRIPVYENKLDGDGNPTNVSGAKAGELVIINLHASAYDKGGLIRKEQVDMLAGVLSEEYAKGNWVIAGGDFNHAIGGSENHFLGKMQSPEWVQTFDDPLLPAEFKMLVAENSELVATCRDASIPYEQGVNYEVNIDGFIVSDNVKATTSNIDAGYEGSDHNPVLLNFYLQK